MKLYCLTLVLSALCLTEAMDYNTHTADMEFLQKQKNIFELFFYVGQNNLMDAEFSETGRNWDLRNNMDSYLKKEYFQEFMMMQKEGFLTRDAIFTPFYEEHRYECRALYNLLYWAKDFLTFYKTACWARMYMNEGTFMCAMIPAVVHRNDTKMMRLPEMWEIYPYLYFNSRVIQEAQRLKMTRGTTYRNYDISLRKDRNMDFADTFILYSNYTNKCCQNGCTNEWDDYKLDYFMEDIGLNNFYFYFRMAFPYWVDMKDYDIPKNFRGRWYMYMHQQLMARYNLERYSNDMDDVEWIDWYKDWFPGFCSTLTYANGRAMPYRDMYYRVPYWKNKYIKEFETLEFRIFDAIDSGRILDDSGKSINIWSPEGLSYLGNIIEGNEESCNINYYGSYEILARDLLGVDIKTSCKNNVVPSSLQYASTSLRDPMFWRINRKLANFFVRYYERVPAYSKDDLMWNGIRIDSVKIDKLMTFMEPYDAMINNAVSVETMKDGRSFNIMSRQYRMNYKPFNWRLMINSDKETKAYCRIFIGPAEWNENQFTFLKRNYMNYFELDTFIINLKSGMNTIDRHSSESFLMKKDRMSAEMFYRTIQKALDGNEPYTYDDVMFGFPERMMLPRGKPEGMRYKMFFFIYPFTEKKMNDIPMFGKYLDDGKPLGYPLNMPMKQWFMDLPNAYFKDIMIYMMDDMKEKI